MSNIIVTEFRAIRKYIYILVAMGLIGRATGPDEISNWCGVEHKTAKNGLKFLELSGHVHRIKRQNGWLMTSEGQLFLFQDRSFLPTLPTTTLLINSNNINIKDKKEASIKDRSFKPVYSPEIEYPKWLVFKGTGVGEPSRSTLARMDITLEYIEAHIKQWRLDKKPVGMLVHRIKNLDEIPIDKESTDYTEGKFKDHIES